MTNLILMALRKIRSCEGEVAAQVIFEHVIKEAVREECTECAKIADFAEGWVGTWKLKYGNGSIADAIRMRHNIEKDTYDET